MPTFSSPPRLLVLCGRSYAGKSMLADVLGLLGVRVVSLDEIMERRGLSSGDGLPLREWQRTHEIAVAETAELLDAGLTVAVDDTGSPRFLRDGWRSLALKHSAVPVLIYLDASPELVRERWRANATAGSRHQVVEDVLEEHLAAFEPPAADEHPVVLDALQSPDEWRATMVAELGLK
jgi:predicted kinase